MSGIESAQGHLKADAFRAIPATRQEARFLIHAFIDAFNNARRIHSSLTFQAPIPFERFIPNRLNEVYITSVRIFLAGSWKLSARDGSFSRRRAWEASGADSPRKLHYGKDLTGRCPVRADGFGRRFP